MRTGEYLRTIGKLNVLKSDPEDVEVALDNCAEVDTVDVDSTKQRRLKPCTKGYPTFSQLEGNIAQQVKGAYWVR
jgi:hypothetical protein